jgi:hypothetical protein
MVGMLAGGNDVKRELQNWVKRTATGLIPFSGLLRTFRKGMDDTIRETRNRNDYVQSLLNAFANVIPGFSDSLPPKRDWKGEIMTYEPFWPARSMSPVRYSAFKGDVPSQELADNGVPAPEPPYLVRLWGDEKLNLLEIDPTGHLYDKYLEMVGKARYEEVKLTINDLRGDPDAEIGGVDSYRAEELEKAVADGRKYGTEDFLDWYIQEQYKHENWPPLDQYTIDEYRRLNKARIEEGEPQEGPFLFLDIQQSGKLPEGLKRSMPTPEF